MHELTQRSNDCEHDPDKNWQEHHRGKLLLEVHRRYKTFGRDDFDCSWKVRD